MIKTESIRRILSTDYKLPDAVRRALDEHNKGSPIQLDLLFDEMDNAWQFYLIKQKGVIPDEDVLCWQMSCPNKGTGITPGVLNWLKKYDTSKGGLLCQDELRSNWVSEFKIANAMARKRKDNALAEIYYVRRQMMSDFATQKTGIAVPRTVGICNGKLVKAVPKGTAKRLRESKVKLDGV